MMIRFFVEFVEGSDAQNLGLNPDGDFLLWDSEKEGDGNWHVWAKKNSERCLASPQNNIPPSGIMGIPIAVYDLSLIHIYEGKTQMEVAAEIGISQAQVSRLEKGALGRVRKQL